MGKNSNIEWCDHTFNPWIGCQKVSPACDGCFAEALMDLRYHRVAWGQRKTETTEASVGTRSRTSVTNWRHPIGWNAAAAAAGTRPRVFCASLADVFDNQVPPEWRADLFDLIQKTPNLIWLLLTKRPQNIIRMVKASGAVAGNGTLYLPDNVALGTTTEDQARADINIPELLLAKAELGARLAFVSCEPLLGPIDLTRIPVPDDQAGKYAGHGYTFNSLQREDDLKLFSAPSHIDWVIAGGETDQGTHRARPAHPKWYRALRDQCEDADTAFHFKQWGNWWFDPKTIDARGSMFHKFDDGIIVLRAGKAGAGRLLDGVEYNGFPQVAA